MLLSSASLILACLLACVLFSIVYARSYNNGLVFYDLRTQASYLPPTISVSRGRLLSRVKYSEKGSIWSTFGQPCDCSGVACGCCAGVKIDQYRFDQKICANITYVPQQQETQLEIFLNERPSSKYGISLRDPSPFCIPVMMGVPMAMCVQMTDIAMVGNNVNMCMDFVVRLATTDLFEMHFQCMRMGLDGVMYVDKNGQPVVPSSTKAEQHTVALTEEQQTEATTDYDYETETEIASAADAAESAESDSSHSSDGGSQEESHENLSNYELTTVAPNVDATTISAHQHNDDIDDAGSLPLNHYTPTLQTETSKTSLKIEQQSTAEEALEDTGSSGNSSVGVFDTANNEISPLTDNAIRYNY